MKLSLALCLCSVSALLFSSCGMIGNSATAMKQKADKMRSNKDAHDINDSNSGGGALAGLAGITPQVNTSRLPAESDILWAPEDPNAPIEELEELWTQPLKTDWYISYDEALSAARREGKPVLIWFTDSKSSPTCKQLSNEVFSVKQFENWADENVVRLRIDSYVRDDNEDRLDRKIEYVKNLKERYKVLGSPVVLMLSPRGTVFGRYVGYKSGSADFYFGRLKQSHHVSMSDYGEWKESMEKRGYRVWHDNRGRTVFAKLLRYSNGQLLLVEPDGRKSRTTEKKLSPEDRQWLENEKAKRNQR